MPLLNSLQNTASTAKDRAASSLNRYLTPEQRTDIYNSTRAWCLEHPKLSTFLAAHILLSTTPILIFTTFALSILLSSLVTCIVVALALALSFSAFCIGCAFCILVPVVAFTAFAATCLWFWAVVAWWVVARFRESGTPVPFVGGLGTGTDKDLANGVEWDGVWKKGAVGTGKVGAAEVVNGDGKAV